LGTWLRRPNRPAPSRFGPVPFFGESAPRIDAVGCRTRLNAKSHAARADNTLRRPINAAAKANGRTKDRPGRASTIDFAAHSRVERKPLLTTSAIASEPIRSYKPLQVSLTGNLRHGA